MAEPKYRTIRIPKPRSRGIRGKMALQKWQRSGGRQKQILNPETGKYVPVLFGDAGQRQLQKFYPTKERGETIKKVEKSKVEQSKRNIAGAAEAKKKAAALAAKPKPKFKRDSRILDSFKATPLAKAGDGKVTFDDQTGKYVLDAFGAKKSYTADELKKEIAKSKEPKFKDDSKLVDAFNKTPLGKSGDGKVTFDPNTGKYTLDAFGAKKSYSADELNKEIKGFKQPKADPKPAPPPPPAPVAKAQPKPKIARPTATRGRGEPDIPMPPKAPALAAEPPPPPKRIVPKAKAAAPTVAAEAPPTRGALTRGEPEAPPPPPPVRITEEAPKPPASSSNLADIPEIDQVKLNAVLKDLKNKVISPDFKTPTQSEIAEAVTKATGGRYTPPVAKVAEPEPPKAESVVPASKSMDEEFLKRYENKYTPTRGGPPSSEDDIKMRDVTQPTVIDIPGGGQIKIPSIPAPPSAPAEPQMRMRTGDFQDENNNQIDDRDEPRTTPAVTRVPTPQAVLDANKAAGSPVADVLAIANAQKIGGDLNADQIRSLINEGKMDPDDDFFTDKEGLFGEPGLRYNKGVPETVVDQIVKDRQQTPVAQQPVDDGGVFMPMPGQAPPPRDPVTEPLPEPTPEPPPPPKFVNMDPMQGYRETYIPTNILGQAYDPSVRDAYTQQMMQAGANIQSGGYPMFKTPTSAIPQVQFGGYGAPMPISPLMPYAGLAAPQPPQMASGAIVNPGTGEPMPVGMAPPPRIPGT